MRLKFAKGLLLISCCFGLSAHSKTSLPAWIQLPLTSDSELKTDIYTHSIADSVFVELGHNGFLPPVQHIGRLAQSDLGKQIQSITKEISHSLAIDAGLKPPIRLRGGPFKAGPKHNLNGSFTEFQSTDSDGINYITCMAFVKDGDKLHAVYVESFLTSLPKCADDLVRLARAATLFKTP